MDGPAAINRTRLLVPALLGALAILTAATVAVWSSWLQEARTDGACLALTGSTACTWEMMTQCEAEDGGPVFPCAWTGGPNGTGKTLVYLQHECPPVRGAECINLVEGGWLHVET